MLIFSAFLSVIQDFIIFQESVLYVTQTAKLVFRVQTIVVYHVLVKKFFKIQQ